MVTLRLHDKRHTVHGRQCADHTPRQPVGEQHYLGRRGRISDPIQLDTHMLHNAIPNVQLSEAFLPVAHGPTVHAHQSVTDIPHHRPSPPNFSQLAALSCFEVCFSNRQQRLHALNLPFSCLHSMCDAAGGQHPSRKLRRDAARLSTSPDTKLTT